MEPWNSITPKIDSRIAAIEQQPKVDAVQFDLDGATALHYVARISAPENPKQYGELLKLMLRKGAIVNDANRHKETPLHQAAMKGATLAVDFLVANKVSGAYRRSDLFDRRQHLMRDWAEHCDSGPKRKGSRQSAA